MDLFSYELSLEDRASMHRTLERAAERARTRYGVRLRRMTRRSLRRDLDAFADVYNSAWSRNWGFVPYSAADLDAYAVDLQLVYHPEWFMVAELDGDVVGASISVIDINQVLRRMNGRLLPLGWWHFLRRNHIIDRVRVGFLGAKPESWHTGAAAALYVEQFAAAARSPFKYGEAGWILEINHGMNRALEAMNGRIVKRYRVYERGL
jgi:hypothetical protein